MHNITIDFNNPGLPQVIDVMQSDAQSRFIGLTLYDGGVPYSAPSGAVYTVEYHGQGANNTGWYDTIQLSSGTRKAVVVSSSSPNVVTLELAEQALRVNGKVEVSLCVVNNTGYKLNTFPIICRVTGAPYVDPVAVRSYFYVTGLTSEQWTAYVTACQDAQKRAEDAAATFETDPTLSVSGKAADAEATGGAISEIKEDVGDVFTTYYDDKTGKVLGFANGNVGSEVSISSQNWCAHTKVSVIGGTKLYVKTKFDKNYTSVPVVLFSDAENLVIGKLTKSYSVHDYHTEILDVPSNAKYAYINISDSSSNVYDNCIAGVNYTKISAKKEIDSLKSFNSKTVNGLHFCRVDNSIIDSDIGYPIFKEGVLSGWGTQVYITHRMFAVNSDKHYAFDANDTVIVYFLDTNKYLISRQEYESASYWYHKIIDALPLNCAFLIVTSNPSNNFIQNPPVCYELFSSNDGLPNYYHLDSYIENKVQTIRDNASIVRGCTFAFITDLHFFFNALMSGALLKYIRASTTLDLIICGGDIPPAYGTLTKLNKSAELYSRLTDSLGRDTWLTVKGNHDYCIDGDSPKTLTEGYQYNQIVRPLETSKTVLKSEKNYYYYDLPLQKIRFIILDQYETTNSGDVRYGVVSNITDEQLSWLADTLSVEGYTFLVFSHSTCDSSVSGYDSVLSEVNRMLCAVNNKRVYKHSDITADFTKTTSVVACSVAGHNHTDASNTTDGLLSITTTSDAALGDGGIARIAGTISEQAFDIITIDSEKKKIKATRIGGGNDREWSYK